jgi:hypothetical protein
MTENSSVSLVDEMRQYIRQQVASGFLDAKEIEQAAIDGFLHDLDDKQVEPALLERIAGVETDKAFAAQLNVQRQWPAVTDCDRLDRAFADLNRSGIVARQNFACCTNCGHAEIGAEVEDAEKLGTKVTGYAFFHFQDTERAVVHGDLFLTYSDLAGDQTAGVRIGQNIVEALRRHGLAVEWNGSFDKAILVKLKWQRRVSKANGAQELEGPLVQSRKGGTEIRPARHDGDQPCAAPVAAARMAAMFSA